MAKASLSSSFKDSPSAMPQSQPETSTKRVTLKLKVKDEDLSRGELRKRSSTTPATAAAAAAKPTRRKSTPGPRAKKGRPKKSSGLNAPVNSPLFGPDEDEEQEEGDEESHEVVPSITDFRPLSLLSFPVLVSSKQQQLPDRLHGAGQPQPQDPKPKKHCAACGVPAPPQTTCDIPDPNTDRGDNQDPSQPDRIRHPPPTNPYPTQDVNSPEVTFDADLDVVIARSDRYPSSATFWYDVAVAEMARRSSDLDFKMLCLNLMRWKAENDDSGAVFEYRRWVEDQQHEDVRQTDGVTWDRVLEDVVREAKTRGRRRREKERKSAKVAEWAVWESRMRRRSRGRFVRDLNGAWVVREPGLDGAVRKVLALGYKRLARSEAVIIGGAMDVDVDVDVDGPFEKSEDRRGRALVRQVCDVSSGETRGEIGSQDALVMTRVDETTD